jgi:hypothetical protein
VAEAAARIDPRVGKKTGRQGVILTTEPLPLDAAAVDKIQRAGGVRLPNVTYRVYPHFGAEDDLYSLGMVLFLCALVNDTQDLGLVMDDLALLGLRRGVGSGEAALARDQLAGHPETWGPNAIFFDVIDRGGDRPNAIPDELWVEVLSLGLRMVSSSPDLVGENESGTAIFERVETEIADILCRLRALLFDRQPLNLEIQSVIAELLAAETEK